MKEKQNPITWMQFNNAVPIIGTIVSMVFFFAMMQANINNLSEKMVDAKRAQESQLEKITKMGNDIVEIKTTLGIRKEALMIVTPTPAPNTSRVPSAVEKLVKLTL